MPAPKRWLTVALPLGGVLLLVAAAVIFAPRGSGPTAPKPPGAPAPDQPMRRVPLGQAGFRAAPVRSETDLLALVDVDQDIVKGDWKKDKGVLASPETPWARLQLPCFVPEEYDLVVVAERATGTNSLNLGLSYADRQFVVIFDGGPEGNVAGLDGIEGRPFFHGETAVRKTFFPAGKKRTVVCRVRRTRLEVDVDGERVVEWIGDHKKLTLLKEWAVMDKGVPFLGTWASSYRFHKVSLTPVRGTGISLR